MRTQVKTLRPTSVTLPSKRMNFVLALLVVVGFAVALESFNLPAHSQTVWQRSKTCLEVLRDRSLEDREKEMRLREQALHLFRLLGLLVGGSVLALGPSLFVVWLLEQVGVGSLQGTLTVLERIDFLASVTCVGLLGYLLLRGFYSSS